MLVLFVFSACTSDKGKTDKVEPLAAARTDESNAANDTATNENGDNKGEPIAKQANPNGFEQDDCAADISQYTDSDLKKRVPVFKPDAATVKKALPSQFVEFGFQYSVLLKSGLTDIYTEGGCAHYAYRFVLRGEIPRMMGQELKSKALELMSSLELTNNDNRGTLIDALKQTTVPDQEEDQISVSMPCGDPNCTLSHTKGEIELVYDFAL